MMRHMLHWPFLLLLWLLPWPMLPLPSRALHCCSEGSRAGGLEEGVWCVVQVAARPAQLVLLWATTALAGLRHQLQGLLAPAGAVAGLAQARATHS